MAAQSKWITGMYSARQLRSSLQVLSKEQKKALLDSLPQEVVLRVLYDWEIWARDDQLAPPGNWLTWLALAGRGWGKTRTGAEWVRGRVEKQQARRIALVAPTAADVRDVMVEGESGILRISPPWNMPKYEPSKRRLTWPNGATATTFSADEPERLRGPQFDTAWCDEVGSWRYAQDAWDNLQFGLRLGDPRVCVTTTPRPIKLIKDLLKDPMTAKTRGSTYANRANLAASFFRKLKAKYEGTRLGRQELFAELLEDTPGALWTLTLLQKYRVSQLPCELDRIVVSIDPAASSDQDANETGITVDGKGKDGHGYLLDDVSGHYTPAEWGAKAIEVFDKWEANLILGEVNNGGEMVEHVIKTVREGIPFKAVHASRGKLTRAEPVASLDEQGRIHHVGVFPNLEDQMTTWIPGEPSPDRMDSRVWGFTELLVDAPSSYTSVPRGNSNRGRSLYRR